MRIIEVLSKPKNNAKPKRKVSDQKTDWERNATELRSKERKLKPQSPVPPIKHRP
jgi:hypothetical protein